MVRRMMPIGNTSLLRISAGLALLALASCAQPSLNPADWYHALEGGVVAEQRPPPPRVDAPYPNLGSVPARPAPIDAGARGVIGQGLVADRTNAQYAASQAPLPPPTPQARPVAPAPRPAGDEAAGASLPAASAPPAAPVAAAPAPATKPIGPLGPPQPALPNVPSTPPRRAPTQAVQASALPPPAVAEPRPDIGAKADAPLVEGRPAEPQSSLPTVPTAPPPPPVLPGIVEQAAPAPAPRPAPPPVVAAAPVPAPAAPGSAVLVAFQSGSVELPPGSLVALKVLSQQRAGNPILVTGYGDQTGSEANAQAKALPLALERARVVAARLLATGVPASAIRISAEAQGRGAAARIVN
jgi:outer membrane protein OmpA-like peptidoglycan-associated protein